MEVDELGCRMLNINRVYSRILRERSVAGYDGFNGLNNEAEGRLITVEECLKQFPNPAKFVASYYQARIGKERGIM